MSDTELENKIRLNQARREAEKNKTEEANKNNASTGRNFIRRIGPMAALNTAKDAMLAFTAFRLTDVFIYGIALILALFKDLLDLAILALPGFGAVIVMVITWCISIAIGLLMMFDGVSSAKRKIAGKLVKRMLVLIAGTIVESFLFGLNFFPFEMFTVGVIYFMSLMERKQEKRLNNEQDKSYAYEN